MRLQTRMETDNRFKLKFSSAKSEFSNLKFNKTSNDFGINTNVHSTDEDVYYDEIVYYDGGGVEGYGN